MSVLNLAAYKPIAGAAGDAGQIASGFSAIEAVVNALDNNNFASGLIFDPAKLMQKSATVGQVLQWGGATWAPASAFPVGTVVDYGAAAAPTGWLLCDGSSVLRADYAALFAIIGTLYGSADGTHFNVPDCRGRVSAGYAASGGHTDVATLGNNEGSVATARRPKHPHSHSLAGTISDPAIHDYVSGPAVTGPDAAASAMLQSTAVTIAGTVGLAGTANDAPSYIVLNKIIKT